MANTGAKLPTAAATASEAPYSGIAWTNPGNLFSDNGVAASIVAPQFDTGIQGGVLKAYTFDMSTVPAGATIDGVVCTINAWCATANAGSLNMLMLTNTALARVGDNQCATAVVLTATTTTVITKGSSTDVWGNVLTAAWVKHANFGLGLSVIANADNCDVMVDYVDLTVYYTPGAGWANIAKVSGVAASAIAKVNGAATSTIAKVYGVAV